MRKVILSMMTTINGRLDQPFDWMGTVSDDHYRRINERARRSDTLLVGRTTYDEMVAYWPDALRAGEGTESNRAMAQHMHDVEKLVISRSGARSIAPWHNARMVVAPDDAALSAFIAGLKARDGREIQLAGGASLAQAMTRLGLIDGYEFSVFPTISTGQSWFGALEGKYDLELTGSEMFGNGVLGVSYQASPARDMGAPERFTELLH